MSYSSVAKLPPGSKGPSSVSKTPSPNPKKKITEFGVMTPVIRGIGHGGNNRSIKFERYTQTLRIMDALPFDLKNIMSFGSLMKVRLSDNKSAVEYSLIDIAKEMIQVRPGEGKNGIDIVLFKDQSFSLNNFHLTAYIDMQVGFVPSVDRGIGPSSFIAKAEGKMKEREDSNIISGLMLRGMSLDEHLDEEAYSNVTGSPKNYAKNI